MTKKRLADTLFWLLAAGAAALLGLFVLVLAGVVTVDSARPAASEETSAADGDAKPATRVATKATKPATTTAPQPAPSRAKPATPPAQLTNVTIAATRGDCWVLARVGSENGRTLTERILLEGESMTLRARAVWLSLGASANVDVRVNGKARELAFGTVAVVLTPRAAA